jgi:translation initiation factor 2 beta subunit (eIF-2beta)/eIF-5
VKDLIKELETKESTNKETVQILKQEFIEHKTTYEKVETSRETNMFRCT